MAVGIIAEYNPLHNGHLYQINKVKEMFKDEEIILILSGNYTERGDASIIDKWTKTDLALSNGIDLVVELPFPFATQSADFFAKGSLKLLEELKVDYLVFGSESDDINSLTTIAKCQIDNPEFETLVKMYSKFGENYPTAVSKAVYDLTNKKVTAPNDLLGVSYIKEIIKNNYNIKPVIIKRENDYHSLEIDSISSATAIREALFKNIDIKKAVPENVYNKLKESTLHFIDDYFNLLKYKIINEKDLTIYQTVDEGIDNLLKKKILEVDNYDDLIKSIKSKRYTYNKIKRMLLHILVGFTKDDSKKFNDIEYIRILGFNDSGKNYLNKIKKDINIPILSKFKREIPLLELELKATTIYSIPHNETYLIKKEYQNNLGKK